MDMLAASATLQRASRTRSCTPRPALPPRTKGPFVMGRVRRTVTLVCPQCGRARDVNAHSKATPSRLCKSCVQTKHGASYRGKRPRLYSVWGAMLKRCGVYKGAPEFITRHYVDRGITVCPEWRDFSAFQAWAESAGYQDCLFIDRIDNDLGYSPANCRFVTLNRSNRNQRRARMVTAFGKTQCLADWAEERGLPYMCLFWRLERGWPIEKALTEPVDTRRLRRRKARAEQEC